MPEWMVTEVPESEALKAEANPNYAPKEVYVGKIKANTVNSAFKKLKQFVKEGKFGGSATIAGEVGETISVKGSARGGGGGGYMQDPFSFKSRLPPKRTILQ